MSGEHEGGPGSPNGGDGRAEREERLLHGLLEEGRSAREGTSGADPELLELERFLATCRAALTPRLETDAERLAEGVIARTTRDDPTWRGDLRLVRGFVAARWRASLLLRVAAASLVLHVAALPLLAYFGYGRRAPEFTLTFALPRLPVFGELVDHEPEPEREVELEPLGELPAVREVPVRDELEIENALRWARFHLEQGGPPAGGEGTNPVTRVLAERGSYLRGEGAAGGLSALQDGSVRHPVARALAVELGLDRLAVEGRSPTGLPRAIEGLLGSFEADGGPARALELRTLLRARAYGALDPEASERLSRLLTALPADLSTSIRDWNALAPGAPLDRGFLGALEAAAGAELAADEVGRRWSAWGE